jgi:DNA phosphorothioation-associated DGQHR protein 1
MTDDTFPFTAKAVLVDQPMYKFFAASIPANILLQVAFSDVMQASINADGIGYTVTATQRTKRDERLKQIAAYIDREDSGFPNSIILAANYREDGRIEQGATEDENEEPDDQGSDDEERPDRRWLVKPDDCGGYTLTIPTADKLAAVIDGQHRLFAFAKSERADRLNMNLLCAVFLDLPKPYQAQLFATINSTQKPVDKSLTYELFGYNVEDEEPAFWSPDKLAVFFARKLATEDASPLRGKVIVAPQLDETLKAITGGGEWKVSTAVIVEGIMRLFSANPKRDTQAMLTPNKQTRAVLASGPKDRSPLRSFFLAVNDTLIYTMVFNYLKACDVLFWQKATDDSFIKRAVGVQALFDVLRKHLAVASVEAKDVSQTYFEQRLLPAAELDFSEEEYKKASSTGRTTIRKALETTLGFI